MAVQADWMEKDLYAVLGVTGYTEYVVSEKKPAERVTMVLGLSGRGDKDLSTLLARLT